jgi:Na+-driven multidrug efflux pump
MSEFFTNICLSLVAIIYNAQLMSIVGIMGVSAYGVMQYLGFIFIAVFLGYAVGSAPIIGYQYGAQNDTELKNVLKKSLLISAIGGVVMTLVSCLFARPLSAIFVGGDQALLDMTTDGMRLYSLCFLGAGLNIFASAFFTALSNGGVSLLISFFRTFLCQAVAVLVLPKLFGLGLNGVWLSAFVAEIITLILTIWLLVWQRKRYNYA